MNYKETIDFLFSSLPMFQRIGDAAIKKDLTNIKALCSLLGEPQLAFQSVHIAGTNGKGSTSHMLASIFQAAGKKVGLYTSPHYVDFRERIKINGVLISEDDVIEFVEMYKDSWSLIEPSFFEITVAMAFHHFRKENVDIAIIETGLGGRLDSTNIITPMLSIVTNISYDHTQILGESLKEIAFEKAGIIKQNVPVIIGEWNDETRDVFLDKAKQEGAPLDVATEVITLLQKKEAVDHNYYVVQSEKHNWLLDFQCDLQGPYQEKNIRTVLAACLIWNQNYDDQQLSDEVIRKGLQSIRSATNMIGRWMQIQTQPLVIADAAHNVDGFQNVLPAIMDLSAGRRHFVLGFVSDKDVMKILSLFPKDGVYYWCSPDIPRGKSSEDSQKEGLALELKGQAYPSVMSAYDNALMWADGSDFIYVGGSSYVVGDFLAGLAGGGHKKSPK